MKTSTIKIQCLDELFHQDKLEVEGGKLSCLCRLLVHLQCLALLPNVHGWATPSVTIVDCLVPEKESRFYYHFPMHFISSLVVLLTMFTSFTIR